MTNKQPEAMQVAEYLENDMPPFSECALKQAAALLRTQHAEIERKDALLQQVVKAYEMEDSFMFGDVVATIKQELSQ